jgi:thiamine-monophosphate kinase
VASSQHGTPRSSWPRSSEHERIARLSARFATSSPEVRLGIGDDAAWLAPDLVLSVDAQVEGVHFLPRFAPYDVLAERAATAALSDLAAMGARPLAMLSSLILPRTLDDAALDQLHEGLARAADRYGAPVVGGNLAAGSELSLSTTVLGRADAPLLRTGARPGDGVYVTGHVGARALGLRALLAVRRDAALEAFVDAWLHPTARITEGLALRGVASTCIDISDGLLADLGHVLDASQVGADVELAALPFAPGFEAACALLDLDALALALDGGEAYELVFTATTTPPITATRIGTIRAEPGVVLHGPDGSVRPHVASGFDHFRT